MSVADPIPLEPGLVAMTGEEGRQKDSPPAEGLAQALRLEPHLGKKLSMLSTGSRRKIGLVVSLAAGATVTCLDQPFAALDAASAGVLRDFLAEAADHATRTWDRPSK